MNHELMSRLDQIESHIKTVQHVRIYNQLFNKLQELEEAQPPVSTIEEARISYLIGCIFFREGTARKHVEGWSYSETQSLQRALIWFDSSDKILAAFSLNPSPDLASQRTMQLLESQLRTSSARCDKVLSMRQNWVPFASKPPSERNSDSTWNRLSQNLRKRLDK